MSYLSSGTMPASDRVISDKSETEVKAAARKIQRIQWGSLSDGNGGSSAYMARVILPADISSDTFRSFMDYVNTPVEDGGAGMVAVLGKVRAGERVREAIRITGFGPDIDHDEDVAPRLRNLVADYQQWVMKQRPQPQPAPFAKPDRLAINAIRLEEMANAQDRVLQTIRALGGKATQNITYGQLAASGFMLGYGHMLLDSIHKNDNGQIELDHFQLGASTNFIMSALFLMHYSGKSFDKGTLRKLTKAMQQELEAQGAVAEGQGVQAISEDEVFELASNFDRFARNYVWELNTLGDSVASILYLGANLKKGDPSAILGSSLTIAASLVKIFGPQSDGTTMIDYRALHDKLKENNPLYETVSKKIDGTPAAQFLTNCADWFANIIQGRRQFIASVMQSFSNVVFMFNGIKERNWKIFGMGLSWLVGNIFQSRSDDAIGLDPGDASFVTALSLEEPVCRMAESAREAGVDEEEIERQIRTTIRPYATWLAKEDAIDIGIVKSPEALIESYITAILENIRALQAARHSAGDHIQADCDALYGDASGATDDAQADENIPPVAVTTDAAAAITTEDGNKTGIS